MRLEEYLSIIQAKDESKKDLARQAAKERWDHVAKPLNSLGKLEDAIIAIEGIREGNQLKKRCIVVLCADNGVVKEGVTQTGQEVTAIVANNILHGRASVNKMSSVSRADVIPVDVGMVTEVEGMITRKTCKGTKNFAVEPAMTREEATKAIETGIELVKEFIDQGYDIIGTGEMGIGNTTTSSAVVSALMRKQAKEMTGRGAGLSSEGISHKAAVIQAAIDNYELYDKDALEILRCVGGFDLACMAGVFLGGAVYDVPIIMDGFISCAAALVAARIEPKVLDYILASHVSGEPAAMQILKELKKEPLLCCNMSLGEGTGATAILPLLDMALSEYYGMPTFQEIEIDDYQPLA